MKTSRGNEKKLAQLPVLLTPAQVKSLLGKVPRGLTNVVQYDPKGRKLFLKSEVMGYAKH